MTGALRRGACPSLVSPMQTGDGLLIRLSLSDRSVLPCALRRIAEAAARHGNGIVEITRRGNLQVRGLSAESVERFAAVIHDLGLASELGVPIDVGPLAGLDPDEIVDARDLAERLRRELAQSGVAARLGPKVSVVIDGGGRLRLGHVSADVRLGALSSAPDPVWELAISGTALSAERLGLVAGADAAECVSLILAALAERGPQARARDIDGSEFRERLGQRLAPSCLGSPPVRDVPSVGLHDLADHGFAVGLVAPFGQLGARQIIELAAAGARLGVADFRLGPDHTLLAIVMPSAAAPDAADALEQARATALQAEAAQLGFIVDPRDPRRAIAACPGAPACASGHMQARKLADAIAVTAADILDGSFTLHVSGCAKGCAHSASTPLTLVGDAEGCGLVVAGDARGGRQARLGHDRAVAGFTRLAGLVRSERLAGERFAVCLDRLGERRLAAAFAGAP